MRASGIGSGSGVWWRHCRPVNLQQQTQSSDKGRMIPIAASDAVAGGDGASDSQM